MNDRSRLSSLFLAALLVFQSAAGPSPAQATASPGCGLDAAQLAAWQQSVAASADVETARERVLADTRLVRQALAGAQRVAMFSEDLRDAGQRLDHFESSVAAAQSPAEVAASINHFGGQENALAMADGGVTVDSPDCHFSTGEIVAIVIGLILGILPGLLLMVLLC